MKMKKKAQTLLTTLIFVILAAIVIVKFAWPSTLRFYIEFNIGGCRKIPIFCKVPSEEIIQPMIDKEYVAGLLPYNFPTMHLDAPRGFAVVQEIIIKAYYKKNKRMGKGDIIYVLHQEKGYFPNLFPDIRKQGIVENYEFLKRTMFARVDTIKCLTDAFFVIMKSIFIPDLGDLNKAKMIEVTLEDKKAFINYGLTSKGNFYDCNIIGPKGEFFKMYIKDKRKSLDLDHVFAIISTIKETD